MRACACDPIRRARRRGLASGGNKRAKQMQQSSELGSPMSRREQTALALLILALFLAAIFRLNTLIVSEPDEGTYVYAGRLVAEGHALYRDLMLAHPPLMMWFIAAVWKLMPGLMPVRIVYILLVCSAWVPFYALARHASRSHLASLAAVALTACGSLFAA